MVAVMATVAKGYDLDYAWRAVREAYRGAGYYLAATEAGEPCSDKRRPPVRYRSAFRSVAVLVAIHTRPVVFTRVQGWS